jgi:transposase-like protein
MDETYIKVLGRWMYRMHPRRTAESSAAT